MSDPTEPVESRIRGRVDDGLFALDSARRVTYVDEAAERLLGVDAEAIRDTPVSAALPSIVDEEFETRCRVARERGEPVELERPAPAGDGRVRLRVHPGDDGATVRVERLTDDAESGLSPESLTDATVTVDEEGTIRQANSAVEPLFGYEPAELVGEPLTTLVPDWLQERHERGFERYLETGERRIDWRDVELPGQRKDGSEVELTISFTEHGSDDDRRFTGVFRDISDRKEHEWALQQAYETFSDHDLEFDDRVRELLELGAAALGMEFGTLSQVRAGEYRFDRVVGPENAAVTDGDTVPLAATICEEVVAREETLAINDIEREDPGLAGRVGNAELGISAYLGVPIVVDGDTTGTFCFFDRDPREKPFTDWEVTFVEHLGQWVAQELEQQRYVEQLHALNEVNQVVHEVADAIIEESTREEIEQRVCESLAATDSYLFAWIGQPNPGSQQVELRAEAGVDGYLDGTTISVDVDAEESKGPTGRALQTGEVQTVQRVNTVPEYDPWANKAEAYGFRSSAAIPIVHEGTRYGVLNLYTERPDAFEGQEREMVGLLGKLVGHAIAAADRKRALLSDSLVELELRTTDSLSALDIPESPTEPVEIEAAVPRGDGEYVAFGRAATDDREFLDQLVENHPHVAELASVDEVDGQLRFEALLTEPPLLTTLASDGGQLGSAAIEGTDMRMEIQLPPQADVRQTLDAVREAFPSTGLVSKQEVSAEQAAHIRGAQVALEELTERQLESLRTAYYAGYFEWPRGASGEEVAELLGISAPTFSQHLRAAERAVFEALFEDDPS